MKILLSLLLNLLVNGGGVAKYDVDGSGGTGKGGAVDGQQSVIQVLMY